MNANKSGEGIVLSSGLCHCIVRWKSTVDLQSTTWRYIPKDITIHNHPCENFKCYKFGDPDLSLSKRGLNRGDLNIVFFESYHKTKKSGEKFYSVQLDQGLADCTGDNKHSVTPWSCLSLVKNQVSNWQIRSHSSDRSLKKKLYLIQRMGKKQDEWDTTCHFLMNFRGTISKLPDYGQMFLHSH